MKKAIYLLAATALFASCNQEVLVDATNDQQPEVSRRIGFDTFVDKATRAKGTNSNALNDFYPAFNVYGWKVVDGTAAPVFEDVTVSYYDAEEGTGVKPGTEWGDAPKTGWYYKYVRYWDKMATSYQFSAYAPTAATKDVKCDEAGLITIGTEAKPIKVEETNLMENPADKLAYTGFEYDYMTAQSDANSLDKVTLNFKHLQAKLNIRIKINSSIFIENLKPCIITYKRPLTCLISLCHISVCCYIKIFFVYTNNFIVGTVLFPAFNTFFGKGRHFAVSKPTIINYLWNTHYFPFPL